MRKISVVIMGVLVLFAACNKETSVIPPLAPDRTLPSLTFPFTSFASTTLFVPFGDTLPNFSINKGYRVQLSDTNESVLAACSGIVTSINPDTAGGNFITLKFRTNSIYSFKYGGITRVAVNLNDSLRAGAILGKVSGKGIIDFQLIINKNTALCPQSFGSPGFTAAINEAILRNNQVRSSDSVFEPCKISSLPL